MRSSQIVPYAGLLLTTAALFAAMPIKNQPSSPAVRYARLPLAFEANRGQSPAPVQFLAHGSGYQVYLAGPEIAIRKNTNPRDAFRMTLEGARTVDAKGVGALPTRVNYLRGRDASQWITGVDTYSRVEYKAVYPGIDLAYYATDRQLEYDFMVAANADTRRIAFNLDAGERASLEANGDLAIRTAGGELTWHKPVAYQEIDGKRRPVEARYELRAGKIGFRLGRYDRSHEVVIDPSLVFSTYIGGTGNDFGRGIAIDSAGDSYITGSTTSTDFPGTENHLQIAPGGGIDAFVAKLNPQGSALVWATYLGGAGDDIGYGIALAPNGAVALTGTTTSSNFPTTASAFQPTQPPPAQGTTGQVAFVTELAANGDSLVYSTYLGGSYSASATSIAVDPAGLLYVAGFTNATDFPVSPGAFQTTNKSTLVNQGVLYGDAIIAKFDPTKSGAQSRIYSTFLGGDFIDQANAIAVDAHGNAYVGGQDFGNDQAPPHDTGFPRTAGAFQTAFHPPAAGNEYADGFITKVNPSGTALVYSTFLGGHDNASDPTIFGDTTDAIFGLAIDASGNAYVTGRTDSADFPFTNGAYKETANAFNPFIAKLNASGSALVYAARLHGQDDVTNSGNGYNDPTAIAIDQNGQAFITGSASPANNSPNAPQNCQFKSGSAFCPDAYVVGLNAAGSAEVIAQRLGGDYYDIGMSLKADSSGNLYVAGSTTSMAAPEGQGIGAFYPTTPGAFETTPQGGFDAFVTKLAINGGGGGCTPPPTQNTNKICTPANGSQVSSPVTVTAASNVPGLTLNRLYLDNQNVFQTTSQQVNTQLNISNGSHHLVLVSYNNHGNAFTSMSTFTVGAGGCSALGQNMVHICQPTQNQTVSSPVQFVATTNTVGFTLNRIYVDNHAVYQVASQQVNTTLNLAAGAHHIVLVSYSSSGHTNTGGVNITVR